MGQPLSNRLVELENNFKSFPKECVLKDFFPFSLKGLKVAFERFYKDMVIDGAIINDLNATYQENKCYKLKDRKFITIDFLVKKQSQYDQNLLDINTNQKQDLNKVVYKLFVGGKQNVFNCINQGYKENKLYQPVQFALPYFFTYPCEYMVSDQSFVKYAQSVYGNEQQILECISNFNSGVYDDVILEVAYDDQMKPFPIKKRDDKTSQYKNKELVFGNDFQVALDNYQLLMDPITKEYLNDPVLEKYFNKKIVNMKQFGPWKNYGQQVRIQGLDQTLKYFNQKKLKDQNQKINVLDIGAGRGVDYPQYFEKKVDMIIAYEPDLQANIQYYKKQINYIKSKISNAQGYKNFLIQKPLLYILNKFIQDDVSNKLSKVYNINLFNANYMIHYLCDSAKTIKELKNFILMFSNNKKALFHMSYYNGQEMYDYLIKNNTDTYDNDKFMFSIPGLLDEARGKTKTETKTKSGQDKPRGKGFESFGQVLEVLLPTINDEVQKEYLVNIEAIKKIFLPEIKLLKTIKYTDEVEILPKEDQIYSGFVESSIFEIN